MGYTIRTIRTARDALVNEVLVSLRTNGSSELVSDGGRLNVVKESVGEARGAVRRRLRGLGVPVSEANGSSSELVSDGGLKGAARSRTAWSSRRPLSEEFS
ncbi:hypothetical protein [Haladaptatus sp. AB643]|uniref:hypothetical protein n=1 Tax=Haladaptatus sp. AB643 TaxID=2934174 RepID=UPI00209C38E0|nr:hypothetical protein [Haladaptatus sp. AB643]MCO8244411.1 hypothetical protein [Haladaptatus sp. AB643]